MEERETTNLALVKDGIVENVGVFYVWDFSTWDSFSRNYELVEVIDSKPWTGWFRNQHGGWEPPQEEES